MGEFVQQFQVMTKPLGADALERFPLAEGRYTNFIKEVYFGRCVGAGDEQGYLEAVCRMDALLDEKMRNKPAGYLRTDRLDTRISPEKTEAYTEMYEKRGTEDRRFPFSFRNRMWEEALGRNYEAVLKLYQETSGHRELSFVRNFGVKLLYWIEYYFPRLFLETMKMRSFPKFVCGGTVKQQEYLFLYLLVLMGCDVLYLNPEQDVQVNSDILLRLSCLCEPGPKRRIVIPAAFSGPAREKLLRPEEKGGGSQGKIVISRDYIRRPDAAANIAGTPVSSNGGTGVRISIPPRPGRNRGAESAQGSGEDGYRSGVQGSGEGGYWSGAQNGRDSSRQTGIQAGRPAAVQGVGGTGCSSGSQGSGLAVGEPLDYVELAKRASSVVMIGVYNKNKECFKTGSGVMISDRGYILTNFHVACEAAYYGIRLEEEEHIFFTDELIKYNQYHDLAILRVDRPRTPIPIYRGRQDLVRGQKVVAIGSPLGLFNTVSDGIISGFRKMEDVSMIQFTAPTSHGSSGGALLDLYGNLIGVITAGYDDGQNLNLAVDYKTVWTFAQGFVQK